VQVLKKHGYKRFSEDAEKVLIELQGTSPSQPPFICRNRFRQVEHPSTTLPPTDKAPEGPLHFAMLEICFSTGSRP